MIKLTFTTANTRRWHVRVTLGLILAFLPQIWEVVGTYELLFCLKRNAASVVLTMLGGGDTQTLLDGKNWTFCTGRQWGHKNFPIFSSSWELALASHTSHLVKLSLPNVLHCGICFSLLSCLDVVRTWKETSSLRIFVLVGFFELLALDSSFVFSVFLFLVLGCIKENLNYG